MRFTDTHDPRLLTINKLKNAYFKFKSTNRQRNEMSNIIVGRLPYTYVYNRTSYTVHTHKRVNTDVDMDRERVRVKKTCEKNRPSQKPFAEKGMKIVSNYMRKNGIASTKATATATAADIQPRTIYQPELARMDFNMHIVVYYKVPGILFIVTGTRNTNRLIYLPLQYEI